MRVGRVATGLPSQPEGPSPAPTVRLPADVRAAVTDRARVEALSTTRTLIALVEYSLRYMPRGWRPPA